MENKASLDKINSSLNNILFVSDIQKKINISTKYLWLSSYAGEFGMGFIMSKTFVNKQEFLHYLERVHFVEKQNIDDKPAIIDGEISETLTYSKQKIEELPQMYSIDDLKQIMKEKYSYDLKFSYRTFLRYCQSGIFPFFKIGKYYLLSDDDIQVGLENLKRRTLIKIERKRMARKKFW